MTSAMDNDSASSVDRLRRFVLDRLAEDEERAARDELPLLDQAEGRGRLRVLRADDGDGLLLVPGPAEAQAEQAPVPFAEKVAMLREEVEAGADEPTLRLLADAYDTDHGWQEEWRSDLNTR